MRTIRILSCALLVGAMAVVTPGGAASAAPTTTYSGEFEGTIDYTACTVGTPPVDVQASGPWSMTLHGTSAKGTFEIYKNDAFYLAYTFPSMKQAPVGTDTDFKFSVYGATQAGLLTVTLKDNDMTYTVAPYNMGGLSCTSVTFHGHLTS